MPERDAQPPDVFREETQRPRDHTGPTVRGVVSGVSHSGSLALVLGASGSAALAIVVLPVFVGFACALVTVTAVIHAVYAHQLMHQERRSRRWVVGRCQAPPARDRRTRRHPRCGRARSQRSTRGPRGVRPYAGRHRELGEVIRYLEHRVREPRQETRPQPARAPQRHPAAAKRLDPRPVRERRHRRDVNSRRSRRRSRRSRYQTTRSAQLLHGSSESRRKTPGRLPARPGALHEFDGRACWWRIIAGGTVLVGAGTVPFAGFALGAYLAGDLGSSILSARVLRHAPWRSVIARRLWQYEQLGGREVAVLIRGDAFARVPPVLRRAKLNPASPTRRASPPENARDLNVHLQVVGPIGTRFTDHVVSWTAWN